MGPSLKFETYDKRDTLRKRTTQAIIHKQLNLKYIIDDCNNINGEKVKSEGIDKNITFWVKENIFENTF